MSKQPWVWFAAALVLILIVCTQFAGTSSPTPFTYDEADYMYAGTQGLWANYTDRDAMSLLEFVNKGRELSGNQEQRVGMSQYVRSTGDLTFYRHYHGPLYSYWIALGKAVGIQSEAGYRASGLILHGLAAAALFWMFLWTFPHLGPPAAWIATALFVMNRTALVTVSIVSQHILFEILAIFSLFTVALYLRTRASRWWYVTTALLAMAFASVEISIVLIGAILVTLVVGLWGEWKVLFGLVWKGTLCFLGTLFVIWPKGVLELNALKGYLYLAYIAIYRKTFSPIGPRELWGFKFSTYPLEFVLPLVMLVGVALCWRKLSGRTALLPFLIYSGMFVGVTMVVTVPYTHYHGSLLSAAAIVGGVGFGELWKRTGPMLRGLAAAVILGSLVLMDIGYYQETVAESRKHVFMQDMLAYLKQTPRKGQLFVPYILVPPLHYYRAELLATGYDQDWTVARLAEESQQGAPSEVLCPESTCNQLTGLWRAGSAEQIGAIGKMDGETVYAWQVR